MKKKTQKVKKTYNRDVTLIDKALRRYLNNLKGPRLIKRVMNYAVFPGGKRLRAVLTLESARAVSGDKKKALPFAAAVELVHNFSLVHDDLPPLDNDDTRRGKPACHRRFGEALAILAGDGLLNLAFGIISKFKRKNSLKIVYLLSRAVGTDKMIGGQALDLEYQKRGRENMPLKSKIDKMKTAALIAASCKIGALAAAAKARDSEKLYRFGMNLGLAFQITDDILDSSHKKYDLAKMKKTAEILVAKGKEYITSFGERANTLKYIADSVLKRIE